MFFYLTLHECVKMSIEERTKYKRLKKHTVYNGGEIAACDNKSTKAGTGTRLVHRLRRGSNCNPKMAQSCMIAIRFQSMVISS